MSSFHQIMTLKCQCTHLESLPEYKAFKDMNEEYLKNNRDHYHHTIPKVKKKLTIQT